MSPDFTDAALAPAQAGWREHHASQLPTNCAMLANASLKAFVGVSFLGTFPRQLATSVEAAASAVKTTMAAQARSTPFRYTDRLTQAIPAASTNHVRAKTESWERSPLPSPLWPEMTR